MKAARIQRFGAPNVIAINDLPRPEPRAGELLVRVMAAGVGHWDALVREGKSGVHQPLPLILGSELSGMVEAIGANVSGFEPGDEVYGATNEQFTGAYGEYALPSAGRMAQKPKILNFVEAASVPIVAVTAWQTLFDYAHVTAGQTVLIHGLRATSVRMRYKWPARQALMWSRRLRPLTWTTSAAWALKELLTIRKSDSRRYCLGWMWSLIRWEELRSSGRFGF